MKTTLVVAQNESLDAEDLYFRDLKALGKFDRSEDDLWLQRIACAKQYPHDQWRASLARDARDRLVEMYQPLVVYLARKRVRFTKSMELLDLVNAANIGLLAAIEDFGFYGSFLSFAGKCMRSALSNAIRSGDGTVRLPNHIHEFLLRKRQVERNFLMTCGREPSTAEVAAAMGMEEKEVLVVLGMLVHQDMKSVQGLLFEDDAEDKHEFVNLFAPLTEVAEDARQTELAAVLQEAMEKVLTGREQEVLRVRYGFGDVASAVRPHKLAAAMLGLSSPLRVNAIEQNALAQLRKVLEGVEVNGRLTCRLRPAYQGEYYTSVEVCQLLNLSAPRLANFRREGRIPAVWWEGVACRWRFPKAAVDALVASGVFASRRVSHQLVGPSSLVA